jgi:hypothetical protein
VAWLNATPQDKAGKAQKTRIRVVMDSDVEPSYPPIFAFEYLISHLFEVGPTMAGSMGQSPLSHAEIRAWQDNTGERLTYWEARMLRNLSLAYMGESNAAEDQSCPAPWGDSMDAANIRAMELQRKIEAFLN